MARATDNISQAELNAFYAWCLQHGVIMEGELGRANGSFIGNYFVNNWKEEITEQNLETAAPQILPHLKRYADENKAEYMRTLAKLSDAEQQVVYNWQPPKGFARNEYNATILVKYCVAHNWKVTPQHLALAASQANVVGHLQIDESKRQRHLDPRSHSSTDDGDPFLGKDVNKPAWKKRQEERERQEREQQQTPTQTKETDAWTTICQQLMQGGTWAQKDAMRRLYDSGLAAGKSPRVIASEMEKLKASYERLISRSPF